MKGLVVELFAGTASFRDPGGQLYHDTLPLPPPSTIVGMAGAAMGKSFEESLEWLKTGGIYVGCRGEFGGRGKDLWNYKKIKSSKSEGGDLTNAIVLRTFLADLEIGIYFAGENLEAIQTLKNAFENPVYAITLGTSDELAKIKKIEIFGDISKTIDKDIKNVWLIGDYTRDFKFDWELVKLQPIKLSLRAPVMKNLPVDYEVDVKGVRKGIKYTPITFLSDMQLLDKDTEVYKFGDDKIPMFKLGSL